MKKIQVKKSVPSRRIRKRFQKQIINDENFVKYDRCFYVFNDAIMTEKFIKKHYDDSLSKYFET